MGRRLGAVLIGIAMASVAMPAPARVAKASESGFVISRKAEVRATPAAIWARLVHPEDWWNKAHSWSGNAANLSMTPASGGCFCEKLSDSGFVEHARIIFAAPGKLLRLSGALGPLQGEALAGTLTVKITPGQNGMSSVDFEYVVGGYSRLPLLEIAPAVDAVLAEQHGRLLKLIASGKPD